MKYFICLFFTGIFFVSMIIGYSQPRLNVTDSKGLKQGKWVVKFENQKARYEGNFKDNFPLDTFNYFYESGEKSVQMIFSESGRKSRAKYFHVNGKMMARGNYMEQKKDSLWQYFDDREILSKEENFKAGKLEGISKVFFMDGTVSEEKMWKNDVENGLCKQFFQGGNIKFMAYYMDGNPDGEVTFYHPAGNIKNKGIYRDAVKDGEWISFNEDGSVFTKETFQNGVLKGLFKENGLFREQFASGNPKAEYTFKNGKKNGPFAEFFDFPLKMIAPVDSTKKISEERETFYSDVNLFDDHTVIEKPKIKIQGSYLNDKLNGEINYFNEKGEIEKTEFFENGKLIRKGSGKGSTKH